MMSESGFQIAVVGATGAMGEELILTLERANLAISSFVPIASRASARPSVEFRGQSFPVKPLGPDALEGVELAFAVLPQGPGDDLLIEAAEAGCTIVDLAGIWRDDPQVPMIALGINSALDLERVPNVGVVTSPGPVALALCAVALDQLLGEVRAGHPLVGFGRLAAYSALQLPLAMAARSCWACRTNANGRSFAKRCCCNQSWRRTRALMPMPSAAKTGLRSRR